MSRSSAFDKSEISERNKSDDRDKTSGEFKSRILAFERGKTRTSDEDDTKRKVEDMFLRRSSEDVFLNRSLEDAFRNRTSEDVFLSHTSAVHEGGTRNDDEVDWSKEKQDDVRVHALAGKFDKKLIREIDEDLATTKVNVGYAYGDNNDAVSSRSSALQRGKIINKDDVEWDNENQGNISNHALAGKSDKRLYKGIDEGLETTKVNVGYAYGDNNDAVSSRSSAVKEVK